MPTRDLNHLLKRVSGKDIRMFPFQQRMGEAILAGKNVVVVAPTGSGKTWGAVLPFIYSVRRKCRIADRMLYALPLRALASGLFASTSEGIDRMAQADECEASRGHRGLTVSIQTGEQQDDPYYEADVCFTTIDQILSAYLNIPVSLGPRLANINAGALVGSLVVFDEIHLFDPFRSGATILEMANRLRGCTQFVLMTATLGDDTAKVLADHFGAELITVARDELPLMASHKDQERRWFWKDEPMHACGIAGCHVRLLHQNGTARTLVICNTVVRAQEIYRELTSLLPYQTRLVLLHSRFTRLDRSRGECVLAPFFGPNASQGNAVLVATQVVEAGMDISADEIHTELCPVNSLVQRAGRCARYPVPRNRGMVFVYELQTTADGRPLRGPYGGKADAESTDRTRDSLKELPSCGAVLDYGDERRLVGEILDSRESQVTADTIKGLGTRAEHIARVMDTGGRFHARELIRHIDSVTVFVSDRPQDLELDERPLLLSVPRVSLNALRMMNGLLGWVPCEPESGKDGDFDWLEVRSVDDIMSAWMACLSPAVADYSAEIGLRLCVRGSNQPISYRGREPWQRYAYSVESYSEHIHHVLAQAALHDVGMTVAARRLALLHDLTHEQVEWLASISCALHDAGKLSSEWQTVASRWQRDVHPEIQCNYRLLAHTTFCPRTDQEHAKLPRYSFPPHALEGAVMVAESLYFALLAQGVEEELTDDIVRVIITAIGRHHSPKAAKLRAPIRAAKGALQELNTVLGLLVPSTKLESIADVVSESEAREFVDYGMVTASGDPHLLLLYWYLVRRVRLADQRSFSCGKEVSDCAE